MEDSRGYHKASDILQLSTLSVLVSLSKLQKQLLLVSPLLILSCVSITDAGLESLPQGLRHLAVLHTITLDFTWCGSITGRGLESLSHHIISSYDNILTNNGPRSLLEGVRHLAALYTVSLDFRLCRGVTDGGLEILSQDLRHLVALHTLNLNFSQ